MNIESRIKEVLANAHLMSLGTQNENGVWVSDVIYVYDEDMNIYWMSDPDTRHSQAILKNPQVAGTITLSNKGGEKNFGIQFEGRAEKIDGDRYDLACRHYIKRKKAPPQENEDILQGDSWYKLVPTKIYLIDEENFGFNRQEFKI